jgi:hypothetical protein
MNDTRIHSKIRRYIRTNMHTFIHIPRRIERASTQIQKIKQ